MLEGAEIINLIFSLIILSVFWTLFRRTNTNIPFYIDLSLILLLMSSVFTIIEGLLLKSLFNFLEHLSYFLALVFMLIAIRKFGKSY